MSIKSKLMISYILLIVFSVSVLGFLIGNISRKSVFSEVTEKSQRAAELINNTISVRNDLLSEKILTDLNFADKLLNNLGEIRVDDKELTKVGTTMLPTVYAGDKKITIDVGLIDDISKSSGTIVSFFLLYDDKLIRISTNLKNGEKSSEGTYLTNDSNVYKKIVNNEPFNGITSVGMDKYITGYKPLLDKNHKVIGAIGLGYMDVNPYLEKTLSDIKIGKTGYVYIMNSNGNMIVHPKIKGQFVGQYDFAKKIFNTKNGVIEYKFNGVSKLAAYKYFEPWDWYIVATANYDDLRSSSISIIKATIIIGLITFFIASILALIMANSFVKPINKLKNCMEQASQGDLTVCSDIKSKDEIGILSNSFNHMIKENNKLLEQTVQYDRLKTEFIANISHELKTPLNIIFSVAQLFSMYLENNENNIEIIKLDSYTHTIKQNCYRLLRLVNNVIDITKIDSGFMELNLENQNIVEVIENISLSTAEYIESMSRMITFDTEVEEKIMAFDPEKLERIILNLISNAIKFTKPEDQIYVNFYDRGDYVTISIRDTGLGIPEDKQKEIFERFKQIDPLLNRSHEGSGIGLSLVKSLVEIQGGKICVISKYGEGAEFIIDLPVKILPEDEMDKNINDFKSQENVEKIQIEFSDIYS